MRITELENINYEMSVKIEELERCNAKLSEDIKLYEERGKRRNKGVGPKFLGIMDTDQEERIMKEAEEPKRGKMLYSEKVKMTKEDVVTKEGIEKVGKEVDLVKKVSEKVGENIEKIDKQKDGLGNIEEIETGRSKKKGDPEKEKVDKDIEYNSLEQNSWKDMDLLEEARRCIGLYPVKSCHILKHYDGNYELSMEDIPRHHNLRERAAKEFLEKKLNWKIAAKIKTKWSRDKNILWLVFQDDNRCRQFSNNKRR